MSLEAALIKKEGALSLVAALIKKGEGEVAPLSLVAALQRTRMIAGSLKMAADQEQEGVKRLLQRVLEAAVLKKLVEEEAAVVQNLKPALSLAAGGKNESQRSSRSSEGEAYALEHLYTCRRITNTTENSMNKALMLCTVYT